MDQISEKVQKGTTTVGIVCKDGIVLAADKRASAGYLIASKDVDKIHMISSNMAVTMAGLVSDAQLIVKLAKAELRLKKIRNQKESTVKEGANMVGGILYQNIRKFSTVPGIVSFLLGGKDKHGFRLYELGVDGSVTDVKKFVSTGSGSMMAYGVMETLYKEDLQMKEGVELATRAISAAMQRDMATGEGLDVFTITLEGAKKVVAKKVVSELK
ncbi:proteasome subunit beta [Candidatus Woesearchaeota archaeon]|jgi:proteasome beta subunit|nr:proteasome subunit beta [Candidatus Woesearchaeota archaeon]MBT4396776.1 proteasome subunit beta [archaeon]MBT4630625.1 proteasome subunit beta [Candidatus Woesearchaeota archaeon]